MNPHPSLCDKKDCGLEAYRASLAWQNSQKWDANKAGFLLHRKLEASCFTQILCHSTQKLTMCITANCSRTTSERRKVKRQCTEAGKLTLAIKTYVTAMKRCCKSVTSDREDISCGRKGIMMVGRRNGVTPQLVSLLSGSSSLNTSVVVCSVGRHWKQKDI